MKIRLIRVEKSNQGTLGVWLLNGHAFCCTLEPPDRNNKKNESCIPCGNYAALRKQSPRYGDTFEITGVPNRTHILIHPGNVVDHTKGCILLGQYFGKLKAQRAVLNSGMIFKRFMEMAGATSTFELEIREAM